MGLVGATGLLLRSRKPVAQPVREESGGAGAELGLHGESGGRFPVLRLRRMPTVAGRTRVHPLSPDRRGRPTDSAPRLLGRDQSQGVGHVRNAASARRENRRIRKHHGREGGAIPGRHDRRRRGGPFRGGGWFSRSYVQGARGLGRDRRPSTGSASYRRYSAKSRTSSPTDSDTGGPSGRTPSD